MDPELLAQLLLEAQPQLSPAAVGATVGGVSRTTLNQLLNPELLVGTGVASPAAITEDYQRFLQSEENVLYEQALQDFMKEQDQWARDYNAAVSAGVVERPKFYSDVASRYAEDPFVAKNILEPIFEGTLSADQAINAMQEPLTLTQWRDNFVWPEDVDAGYIAAALDGRSVNEFLSSEELNPKPVDLDRLFGDLSAFESDARKYRVDLLRWEDRSAEAQREMAQELQRLGPEPTFAGPAELDTDAARRDYFKSIGLEGLSLLPDPRAQYDIPAEMILQQRREQRPSGQTLAEELLARNVVAEQARRQQPLAGGMRMVSGPIRQPAAPVTTGAIPERLGRPVATAPTGAPSGVPARRGRSEALQAAVRASTGTGWLQAAAAAEQEDARRRAAAIGRGLAQAGRTPFQDAMQQMLRYGVLEAGA